MHARLCSTDLRECVVSARTDGRSCREVVHLFNLSVSSVAGWSLQHKRTPKIGASHFLGMRMERHRWSKAEQRSARLQMLLRKHALARLPRLEGLPRRSRITKKWDAPIIRLRFAF